MSSDPTEEQKQSNHEQNSFMNRRMVLKKGGMLTALISGLGLLPFFPTDAMAASQDEVRVVDITGALAARYRQIITSSKEYQQFKQQLVRQYHNTFTFQEDQAIVIRADTITDHVVNVHIPIVGGAGHSFYTATLNPHSVTPLTRRTGIFLPADGGDIHAVLTQDGPAIQMTHPRPAVPRQAIAQAIPTSPITHPAIPSPDRQLFKQLHQLPLPAG